jgi:hypothetical protein
MTAGKNVLILAIGENELRRGTEKPAKRGHEIDRSTVDLLIEQALGCRGTLPGLEIVLTRIWEGFRTGVSLADTECEPDGSAAVAKAEQLCESGRYDQKEVARRAMIMLGQAQGTPPGAPGRLLWQALLVDVLEKHERRDPPDMTPEQLEFLHSRQITSHNLCYHSEW